MELDGSGDDVLEEDDTEDAGYVPKFKNPEIDPTTTDDEDSQCMPFFYYYTNNSSIRLCTNKNYNNNSFPFVCTLWY